MRIGVLALVSAMLVGLVALGCSGEKRDSAKRDAGRETGEATEPLIGSDLGHQAFQPSTRLVVPAAVNSPEDRAARVLAGLSEGPVGSRIFVQERPGGEGLVAWRDVAAQEPDGHQLAYVTEALLALDGVGMEDFELVAQTDSGSAVLVAQGDPEIETLQYEDLEDFRDFVEAAGRDPGFVEVADPGPETVFRAGTLELEDELGVDLSPKSPGRKSPVTAVYDGNVETALVPLDEGVYTDVLAGELVALAVLGDERSPILPKVPTARELGHAVTVPVFGGIAAPAGTPRDVVEELGRAFVGSSSSRTFERALAGTGRMPEQEGPREFSEYVEEEAGALPDAVSKPDDDD